MSRVNMLFRVQTLGLFVVLFGLILSSLILRVWWHFAKFPQFFTCKYSLFPEAYGSKVTSSLVLSETKVKKVLINQINMPNCFSYSYIICFKLGASMYYWI